MNNPQSYIIPHCVNCHNRKDPQLVFNSTILTLAVISLSFLVGSALASAIKQTFEDYHDRCQELAAKWSFAFLSIAFSILIIFFLMYNLEGVKW
jgi:hypothetical protein